MFFQLHHNPQPKHTQLWGSLIFLADHTEDPRRPAGKQRDAVLPPPGPPRRNLLPAPGVSTRRNACPLASEPASLGTRTPSPNPASLAPSWSQASVLEKEALEQSPGRLSFLRSARRTLSHLPCSQPSWPLKPVAGVIARNHFALYFEQKDTLPNGLLAGGIALFLLQFSSVV